jgi:hypothetical protein
MYSTVENYVYYSSYEKTTYPLLLLTRILSDTSRAHWDLMGQKLNLKNIAKYVPRVCKM